MKKWSVVCTFLICLLVAGIPLSLAQESTKKSVVISKGQEKIKAGVSAAVGEYELWLPVDVVTNYINPDMNFDNQEKKLYWFIYQPQFQLETAALDERVTSGITMNLPVNSIEGINCVNIYGLEKLLGLTYESDPAGNIIIKTGVERKDNRLSTVRPNNKWNGKVNLAWDVKGTAATLAKEEKVLALSVLAPTWFSIMSDSGLLANKADAGYIAAAHKKGYKVWALVDNGFDANITHNILVSPEARERVINQLVFYAALYQLDGINIDFENIYDEDKDMVNEFVSEIAAVLKQQNLTLSMDVTVPMNVSFWSKCYDRQKLAEVLDYIMVMTYDEYWASSPASGPVASYPWVEAGLQKTLREVPKEKLLLGIPLYTRLWEERDGYKAKSKTMSMADVAKFIRERELEVVWLDDKGLNYTEYYTDDARYRIWIEDERSLALKTSLVEKYNLAGFAAWRKGFERKEIWQVLSPK